MHIYYRLDFGKVNWHDPVIPRVPAETCVGEAMQTVGKSKNPLTLQIIGMGVETTPLPPHPKKGRGV